MFILIQGTITELITIYSSDTVLMQKGALECWNAHIDLKLISNSCCPYSVAERMQMFTVNMYCVLFVSDMTPYSKMYTGRLVF